MFKKSKVATGVLLALGGSLALSAMAQTTDRVEVTGSRIKSLSVDTPSPVTVIDAKEIRVDGVRNVESFLNNLPQVFADQGANVVNGSTGTANVNLRGLGRDRSLVLVNGRRLPMGSPNNVAADLNQIPAGLIKRVEVLTGGASAVYGSDAVAGVVNFIMNDRFEGVQVDLNHSFYNHKQQNAQGVSDIVATRAATNSAEFKVPGNKSSDGKSTNFSLILGGNFDGGKGNATVFVNYKKDEALLQSERDFSACSLGSSAAGFACGGSGTNATGRITNLTTGAVYTNADSNGTARLYNGATDAYNFGPLNYYQRPSERYGFNAYGNYAVSPMVKPYVEFGFHDDRTVAQIAPGGVFGEVVTVNYDNPLLSASWRAALGLVNPGDSTDIVLQRRNVEGGGRQSEFRNTSFRTVVGIKGDVGPFSYDAFMIEGKVIYSQNEQNYFLSPRIQAAMNVANVNGAAVCAGGETGCVPYNPWLLGGVTQAQLNYLQTPGFRKGYTGLSLQGVNVSADLGEYGIRSPLAKSGIGISVGLERRFEELSLITDPATANGDLSGSGGPTAGLGGEQTVKEVFGEVRIPIIEKMPLADLLQATLTARTSSYASGFDTNTWGVGLEWAPLKQVKVRASVQRAIRAPNLVDLYTAQGNNLFDMSNDPCAGPIDAATGNTGVARNAAGVITDPGRSSTECARTGVTAAQFGNIQDSPAGQYNYLQGGNPNLNPEKSKSLTFGVVLQPTRDISVSVDYFDIKVDDTISIVDPSVTLQKCLDGAGAVFCNDVQRDSLGTLWLLDNGRVTALNKNIGGTRTSGFDLGFSYNQRVSGLGSMGVSYVGTILKKLETSSLPGDSYDCVGLYGANKCGSPNPEYRHKLRGTWQTPFDVEAALTWRHIAKVLQQGTSSNPLLAETVRPVERELAARNYLDVAFNWTAMKGLNLSLGINNLLDKDPPITSQLSTGQGNGNTYPSVYDALGRKVFLTASYKF